MALRYQFVLQLRDERHREKLLDEAQIDENTLTFARSISSVKKMKQPLSTSNKEKKIMNSLMCSNYERRELLKENVPNVEEITNLKIVVHLEKHAINVKEKSLQQHV